MGHVQYYLQYKEKSYFYRNGANPGFHEGVADILSLAVGTATYFQRLGLLDDDLDVNDEETNINILFDMALDRIAFLPFGYLVDKFRWDVYSGVTSKENMNCHWWKLRNEIQGLAPPTTRTYKQFDAGAKYHVAGDVGYVRYFTAYIYEFQFYRQLCLDSGEILTRQGSSSGSFTSDLSFLNNFVQGNMSLAIPRSLCICAIFTGPLRPDRSCRKCCRWDPQDLGEMRWRG